MATLIGIKRYQAIPQTVFAAQYTGTISAELRKLANGLDIRSQANSASRHKLVVAAQGDETPLVLDVGDWLVRHHQTGDHERLTNEQFNQRYREIDHSGRPL